MATSRQGLIDYCLRELGEPIVEINVDDSQIEDRVDEALEYWRLYHYEGIEKVYLKNKITASELYLTTDTATTYQIGEQITGLTSGAKATVVREVSRESSGNTILVKNIVGTFLADEQITGGNGAGVLAEEPFMLGSFDKKYLETTDLIYGVQRILPFSSASSSKSLFDLQYQLRLNDLYDLTSTSIIYYKTVMQHLALLDLELNGKPQFRFNRLQNRIYLDVNWESDIALGDFVVVECYRALDPTQFTRVWDEPWLKHYTTALIKRQWGMNGKKFQGMVLPGGVTIDFQGMYDEANKEIEELRDDLLNKSAPLEFFSG